jgi:hypothetical protein
LYVLFQSVGAVVAGLLIRASLGVKPQDIPPIPGCYIDTSLVTPGEAYVEFRLTQFMVADYPRYVLETMTSFGLIFVAFEIGLDPRQREVFGPALSPVLVCRSISCLRNCDANKTRLVLRRLSAHLRRP